MGVASGALSGWAILIPKLPHASQKVLNSICSAPAKIMRHLRDAHDPRPFGRDAASGASWDRQREVAAARALA
jgi:hypothetical protein